MPNSNPTAPKTAPVVEEPPRASVHEPRKHTPAADRYLINIALGNDGEPKRIFIGGCEEGDFLIERGKDVLVPRSVLTRLDDAIIGVPEPDPADPENNMIAVDRQRFPYTIKRYPKNALPEVAAEGLV